MKGTHDIKRRIKSVKNTSQITRAMQLVAASKMKRAQQTALSGRPYALLLLDILKSLIEKLEFVDIKHSFMEDRRTHHRGILVISTDKGLCGGLNANLFRHIGEIEGIVSYVSVGRKGTQFLSRSGREVLADFQVSDRVNFSEVRMVAEFMTNAYLQGHIDTVEVLFTRFINTLNQEPVLEQLVPFKDLKSSLIRFRERLQSTMKDAGGYIEDDREMIFAPSAQAILKVLPELFVKQEIYQMVLEAKASEQSARMVAMKSATDNAKDLVDDLTLEYNKLRQAAITQEIVEIAAAMQSA